MTLTQLKNAVIGFVFLFAGSVQADDQVIRFGGIEVGSGGVKTVLVELQHSPLSQETWSVKEDSKATDESGKELSKADRDVFLGLVDQKFTPETIQNVAGVVKRFKDKHFVGLPPNRQFLVISSGVAAHASEKQLEDLVRQLTEASGLTPEVITVDWEVRMSFDEVLKEASPDARKQAFVIDIGSGNTKFGGYVGDNFVTGEVPRGMGSEKPRFEGDDVDIAAKAKELSADVQKEIEAKLAEKFQNYQPKSIYLLGGAFWSMMGHTQSQDLVAHQANQRNPRLAAVNPDSFSTYWDWVTSKKDAVTSDDYKQSVVGRFDGLALAPLAKDNAIKAATAPFNAIPGAQRPRAAGFLDGVSKAFRLNAPQEGVNVEFVVESNLVWIRGYVQQKAMQAPEIRVELLLTEHLRRQLNAIRAEVANIPKPMVVVDDEKIADAVAKQVESKVEGVVKVAVEDAIKAGLDKTVETAVAKAIKDVKVEVDLKPVTEILSKLQMGLYAGDDAPKTSLQTQLNALEAKIDELRKPGGMPPGGNGGPNVVPRATSTPDPHAAWRAFQRGRNEYDRCCFLEALKFFEEAVRHDPKETLYWYFRALSETQLALTKESQASAQRVAEQLLTGADYGQLCRALERVQGPVRMQVERYIANGKISYSKTRMLPSLTD